MSGEVLSPELSSSHLIRSSVYSEAAPPRQHPAMRRHGGQGRGAAAGDIIVTFCWRYEVHCTKRSCHHTGTCLVMLPGLIQCSNLSQNTKYLNNKAILGLTFNYKQYLALLLGEAQMSLP